MFMIIGTVKSSADKLDRQKSVDKKMLSYLSQIYVSNMNAPILLKNQLLALHISTCAREKSAGPKITIIAIGIVKII